MTKQGLRQAINEIAGRDLAENTKEALATFMWSAVEDGSNGKTTRARAAIDFLHLAGEISLNQAFQLADLLG